MPMNWQDPAVRDRLLAAIIASFDGAINCREVARLYGEDATYNAIENFLRKPKKDAKALQASAVGREAPAPSPSRPRKVFKTPRTPTKGDGTMDGRITKAKKNGPIPIKREAFVKKEMMLNDEDLLGSPNNSTNGGSDVDADDDTDEI